MTCRPVCASAPAACSASLLYASSCFSCLPSTTAWLLGLETVFWREEGLFGIENRGHHGGLTPQGVNIAVHRYHSTSEDLMSRGEQASLRGREEAYPCLVRAYREPNGWNRYVASPSRASRYWDVVKAHYPERWAEFLADTILGDVPSRGPSLGSPTFERLVAYCVRMGQQQRAVEFVEEMVLRSLELVSPLTFPTPGWVSCCTGCTMSIERHLPMLFSRLTWPSPLARERACTATARLLADRSLAPEVKAFFLRWLKAQHLESICGMALLILLRAKMDTGGNCPIPASEVRRNLPWPSFQSSLLLGEYEPDAAPPDDFGAWHSGDPPASFACPPFFHQYLRNFLPPVYDTWAGEIEKRARIPFRRQWGYEWEVNLRRCPVKLSDSSLRYWFGYRETDERCAAVDSTLSEVYRSAYLRALAWAVDAARVGGDAAVLLTAETIPIDLELWLLRPAARPTWWPTVPVTDTSLDTTVGDIWSVVDALWCQQQSGKAAWSSKLDARPGKWIG